MTPVKLLLTLSLALLILVLTLGCRLIGVEAIDFFELQDSTVGVLLEIITGTLNKRPALDAVISSLLRRLSVLKYLPFLLLCAVERLVLLLELLDCMARRWHGHPSR